MTRLAIKAATRVKSTSIVAQLGKCLRKCLTEVVVAAKTIVDCLRGASKAMMPGRGYGSKPKGFEPLDVVAGKMGPNRSIPE